jgi:phage anti-repressor protein/predicted GIY-YIG superfamily endonuclease
MDLASFLKQHSTISNAFIDSFLSIYDPDTIQTDFVVKISIVSQWLKSSKKTLIHTLTTSYKKGIDFTVVKIPKADTRKYGNNNREYLLTPDCFKRLCMRSRSPRAEEVRTYFIQLESLLVRYKSVLVKGMNAEIKQMERALKPKDPADSAGYIYVLKASPERDSVFKIGRTKDLNKRLATYSTGTVDGVDVVFKFRTDSHKKTEACVKLMLKEYQLRKYKEVFECNLDMIKEVIQKCDDTAAYTRVYANAKADRRMTGGYYMVLSKDP